MTASRIIGERFHVNSAAAEDVLANLVNALGFALPADYLDFCRSSNGGEGMVGKSYLVLWPTEDILRLNREYGIHEYAPHLLLFGSDGADEAYAFDRRMLGRVVRVPFIGFDAEVCVGDSFAEFVRRLRASQL